MDSEWPDPHVFIMQTGLRHYSSDWQHNAAFAEGAALGRLQDLACSCAGYDPFSRAISPGDRVLIKPNLVRDWHPDGSDLYAVITHPAVIRAVVDGVYRALKGQGQITIADAPMGDTDFDRLLASTGIARIAEYYWRRHRFEIALCDLRDYRTELVTRPGGYLQSVRVPLAGDPRGYVEVDLAGKSAFSDLPNPELLEGTSEGLRNETIISHTAIVNRYHISRTVLESNVLVSIPKLKTHSKVGITLNCKGMVGINGSKNRLPHFRYGSPSKGGDQFPDGFVDRGAETRIALGRLLGDLLVQRRSTWADHLLGLIQSVSGLLANKVLRLSSLGDVTAQSGNWFGNDTCWRLAVDLVRIAVFADKNGELRETPQRRFLSIVDGIVAGEGDGPLRPTPRACGVLVAGLHPVAVDLACARLMGFDYHRIRYLHELSEGQWATVDPGFGPISPEAMPVCSNHEPWRALFGVGSDQLLGLLPAQQWRGHIEL